MWQYFLQVRASRVKFADERLYFVILLAFLILVVLIYSVLVCRDKN